MKKHLYIFFLLLFHFAYAQVPQGIPYQAAARNASGQALVNTAVKVRFSILDSVATGTLVYKETHNTTTNSVGLFNVNVGMGTPVTGTFSSINWGKNAKFMQMELDITGIGSSYVDMGTQQMLSVPYALYAGSAVTSNSSGISNQNFATYITPGTYTWTVPAGVTKVIVECWGAGAGGADANVNTPKAGSSGGYGKGIYSVSAGQNITVTVGAGGTTGYNHSGGGSSSFGTYITSSGGSAGSPGYSMPGTSNGNVIAITGGKPLYLNINSNFYIRGGDAPLGGGGGIGDAQTNVNGEFPGGGAATFYISPSTPGCGVGGNGRVNIYW
jgi:hypothetical protein